jgi:hypothetical protein
VVEHVLQPGEVGVAGRRPAVLPARVVHKPMLKKDTKASMH